MFILQENSAWKDKDGDLWQFRKGWFYGLGAIEPLTEVSRAELATSEYAPVKSVAHGVDLTEYVTEEEAKTIGPVANPDRTRVEEFNGTKPVVGIWDETIAKEEEHTKKVAAWLHPDVWQKVGPFEWKDHNGETKTYLDFINEAAKRFSFPQTFVTGKGYDVEMVTTMDDPTPRPASSFVTKDSGDRQVYSTGMQRDTSSGKARFDLLIPEGVPYEAQFLTRFAELMQRGAEKYDPRNWEKAGTPEELARFRESALRHLFQWVAGDEDEDHAAAVVFNLMAHETTKYKIEESA